MVSLITQCKFIDYTEGKEYVFSLDELKNKLKSYITENATNLIGEIEKSIDFDDLEDIIEEINDFYDDDRLLLVTINPSINHLKHCLRVDKIVYLDNETHDTINDNKLIDMDKPVISWDYQDRVLYVYIETGNTSKYDKNYSSKQEAKTDGVDMVMKCKCNECGRTFWTIWRSKYSPLPMCEECQDPLFVTVESIENIK